MDGAAYSPLGVADHEGPHAPDAMTQRRRRRRCQPMPMTSPSELFLHELGDIYDEENRLLQILPALASEVDNQQVKQAFQQHLQETQQQVKNIEQVFQLMGQQPKRQTCAAIQGLKQEHDTFM